MIERKKERNNDTCIAKGTERQHEKKRAPKKESERECVRVGKRERERERESECKREKKSFTNPKAKQVHVCNLACTILKCLKL